MLVRLLVSQDRRPEPQSTYTINLGENLLSRLPTLLDFAFFCLVNSVLFAVINVSVMTTAAAAYVFWVLHGITR